MGVSHSARLSPLQGETVWTLEDQTVIARRGRSERRFDLTKLKSLRSAPGGAILTFARGRLILPAMSYGRGLKPEDRSASFGVFLGAVAAAAAVVTPSAKLRSTGAPLRESLTWAIGLLSAGAVALLVFAALAARLVFVLILAAGALPWLDRASANMDAN